MDENIRDFVRRPRLRRSISSDDKGISQKPANLVFRILFSKLNINEFKRDTQNERLTSPHRNAH